MLAEVNRTEMFGIELEQRLGAIREIVRLDCSICPLRLAEHAAATRRLDIDFGRNGVDRRNLIML